MSRIVNVAVLLGGVSVLGCSMNFNPTPRPTPLVSASGRSIVDATPLVFVFNPVAGRRVTISVQASTDRANPDFRVVRGEIDFEDLDTTPISDLVVIAADEGSGQEIDFFTPEIAEPYTLFIEDANNWPGATFSILVTQ